MDHPVIHSVVDSPCMDRQPRPTMWHGVWPRRRTWENLLTYFYISQARRRRIWAQGSAEEEEKERKLGEKRRGEKTGCCLSRSLHFTLRWSRGFGIGKISIIIDLRLGSLNIQGVGFAQNMRSTSSLWLLLEYHQTIQNLITTLGWHNN